MATDTGTPQEIARKLVVPAAVGVAGSALGLLLTQKRSVGEAAPKLREAVSDIPRPQMPDTGIGDLAGDLKGKVESVLGKDSPGTSSSSGSQLDRGELERRRSEREARRTQRRRARR